MPADRFIPVVLGSAALILAALISCESHAQDTQTLIAQHILPDPKLTPGSNNPNVTQDNIGTTICKANWTKTIRPPEEYTEKLKVAQLAARGYTDRNPAHFEEDHLRSLEIGGNPTDSNNLWPESYAGQYGARTKDKLEDALHKLVCAHKITLEAAQQAISSNWISAYHQYVKP